MYQSFLMKRSFLFLVLHFFFLTDLSEWNRDHVRIWLKSVSQMFDLEMPKVQKFPQTGTQLSSLSKYVIRKHSPFVMLNHFNF